MVNLKLEGEWINKHAVCQAHFQLERDYQQNGMLMQRSSNIRRPMATSEQLRRMHFKEFRWVDIVAEPGDDDTVDPPLAEQVRFVYLLNVLKLGLPHDRQLRRAMRRMINKVWLGRYYPAIIRQEQPHEANATKMK